MRVKTQRLIELRDQAVHHRRQISSAPARVQAINEEQIDILNELIEMRVAIEEDKKSDMPAEIPVLGRVS